MLQHSESAFKYLCASNSFRLPNRCSLHHAFVHHTSMSRPSEQLKLDLDVRSRRPTKSLWIISINPRMFYTMLAPSLMDSLIWMETRCCTHDGQLHGCMVDQIMAENDFSKSKKLTLFNTFEWRHLSIKSVLYCRNLVKKCDLHAVDLGDPLVYAREEINPSTTEGSANVDVSWSPGFPHETKVEVLQQ